MATEKRMLFYFDDVVMAIAKVFKGSLDDCIYSPNEVLGAVQGISPVDAVEVKHGRWIEKEYVDEPYGGYYLFHCSVCGIPNARERNYCPNCGAKMDGDGNG